MGKYAFREDREISKLNTHDVNKAMSEGGYPDAKFTESKYMGSSDGKTHHMFHVRDESHSNGDSGRVYVKRSGGKIVGEF